MYIQLELNISVQYPFAQFLTQFCLAYVSRSANKTPPARRIERIPASDPYVSDRRLKCHRGRSSKN